MNPSTLTCQSELRRNQVRHEKQLYGLDYLEVGYPDPNRPFIPTLTVYFLGGAPGQLSQANLRIDGGQRIRDIKVTGLVVHQQENNGLDDFMEVTVDTGGDFSTYTLSVVAVDDQGRPTGMSLAGFDPRYASVEFSFKACCPSDLDCKRPAVCPPPKRIEPEINYLAKDYASFRQLILDRLALIMPAWQERHVPDLGITLVELLAYVGDHLSYYQDAVATEAYLDTARQRISVRRHARLVDYQMHEGCNARAWVCIHTDFDRALIPSDTSFLAGLDNSPSLADKTVLSWDDLRGVPPGTYEVFELMVADAAASIQLHAFHNEIKFYTWGNKLCCLPASATSATLVDEWVTAKTTEPKDQPSARQTKVSPAPKLDQPERKLRLKPGDVLVLEEVKGPKTGNAADADPSRRWAVRLIQVTPGEDPLFQTQDGRPTPILTVEWAVADALPFPFCLSARLPAPDCRIICNISVARGNVVLVDHGRTLDPEPLGQVEKNDETGECACEGSAVEMTYPAAPFRPDPLNQTPLTFSQPRADDLQAPASTSLAQDPRQSLPGISLSSIPSAPDGTRPLFSFEDWRHQTALLNNLGPPVGPNVQVLWDRLNPQTRTALALRSSATQALADALNELLEVWTPVRDLLESRAGDHAFVVEIDNDGRAHLRFGDGDLGRLPEAGMEFFASYRVGNGTAGNVPADSITKIVFRNSTASGVTLLPRNPLPAQGGTAPEPTAEVKLFAPGAFRRMLERAITAADYATIAERNQKLQQANASLRWTGSWYEAQVAVDPLGTETADDGLLQEIKGYLYRYRRIGHDLVVNPAQYVPLEIEMIICVSPQYLRGHVEAALLDVFSNRALPNGQLGFFHPDNLTFGEGIYLSRLVAAAQVVTGVQSVTVTRFQRLFGVPVGVTDNIAIDTGLLALGALEVAQLDNDPGLPEHGVLKLDIRGGR